MDLTTLTDAEARDLLGRVYADVQRRDTIAQAQPKPKHSPRPTPPRPGTRRLIPPHG